MCILTLRYFVVGGKLCKLNKKRKEKMWKLCLFSSEPGDQRTANHFVSERFLWYALCAGLLQQKDPFVSLPRMHHVSAVCQLHFRDRIMWKNIILKWSTGVNRLWSYIINQKHVNTKCKWVYKSLFHDFLLQCIGAVMSMRQILTDEIKKPTALFTT